MTRFLGLLCALLLFSGCGGRGSSSPAAQCAPGAATAQGYSAVVHAQSFNPKYKRFLVETDGVQALQSLKASGEKLNEYRVVKFQANFETINETLEVVELKDGDRSALIEALIKTPGVKSVEPDFEIETGTMIEENAVPEQWAHTKVDSSEAWGLTEGSEQVLVAVLDGGVDIGHPDLAGNIYKNPRETLNRRDDDGNGYVDDVNGWDYVGNDNNPRSDAATHFHGSHVAGIVGAVANRARMLIGHAPRVRILPLKFINTEGTGNTSYAIRAIDYAVRMKAHIINASWSSTNYSSAMYSALVRAKNAGVLVVAAAGNVSQNNDVNPHYPANYALSNIVSVGASNKQDQLASFSDYGVKTVDFAAPGSSIYSLKNGGAYATMSGTSMATPLVTGIAVLVKSRHPSFRHAEIAQSLFMGVEKLSLMRGKVKYGGRINAYKAITAADQVKQGKGVELESDPPETGICGG